MKTTENDKDITNEKPKKYKFVKYDDKIRTVAHLANYIKVHDVFTDEKRKELYDKFESDFLDDKGNKKKDVDEDKYEKAKNELEDVSTRNEVIRQNLYFKY